MLPEQSKIWTFSEKLAFLEKCFGKAYVASNQKNVEVRCPKCDPKNVLKKKLSIQIKNDIFNCWVCGFRGRLPSLIKEFAFERLDEYVDTFMPSLRPWLDGKRNQGIIIDPPPEKLKIPSDFKLLAQHLETNDPDVKATINYVRSRDITVDDMWYWKMGSSNEWKWRRRLLIPSFDQDGELTFMIGRTIDKDRGPKYETPMIERRDIVFNELNVDWTKRVVLCEGAIDAIKCGENAIPILGSSLSERALLFERIVMNRTPVIVMLDADMVERTAPTLTRCFMKYQVDAKMVDLRALGHSDPGSMTKKQVNDAIKTARSLDWFEFTRMRMDVATRVRLF